MTLVVDFAIVLHMKMCE